MFRVGWGLVTSGVDGLVVGIAFRVGGIPPPKIFSLDVVVNWYGVPPPDELRLLFSESGDEVLR